MLDNNIYDYQTSATQGLNSFFDSLFNSASSSSFGHDPLVAEVKSLKHDVMEMKNTITELKEMIKDMAGHSRFAVLFDIYDITLSNIYTEEKKKTILQNPNRLGHRIKGKPSGLSAKNELIEASKIYFKSVNNVLEGGPVEMDDCELERRCELMYTAMKNFVTVYIFPKFTPYPGFTWMKIGFNERELLALISEDHMFSYIGADNCLPLFAFTKRWGAKNLLVAAIRNRVKSILKTKIQPEAPTTIFNEIEESEDELARDVNTSVSANEGDNLETLDCDETQKTREREFALEQAKLRRSATSSKNNKGPVAKKPRKQKSSSASSHPSVVAPTTKKHI
ncbi:hypothetical protein INT47_006197 [Mucor saturninus]|uniref:Uncharacterized protein n=1 Tax=Mucor saturninus TaxID=64648 RepID=A0A8H7QFC3_9FUNG|nr:hypothetical protein INT47_006197 [Mucor saturninus]